MTTIQSAYEKIADLLAQAEPSSLEKLQASPEMQARFNLLAAKAAERTLRAVEKEALNRFVVLERLVRLAKIRARAQDDLIVFPPG